MAFWTLDRVAALPAMPRFSVEVREIDGKRMQVMTCMDAKIAWVEDDDVWFYRDSDGAYWKLCLTPDGEYVRMRTE